MKKIRFAAVSFFLILIFCIAAPIQTLASVADGEVVIIDGIPRSNITISDIDTLLEREMEALVSNDYQTQEQLSRKLEQLGIKEITYQELATLTGDENPSFKNAQLSSSATFRTVYSTYTSGGKTYNVMRVYATPSGQTGTLYQTGVTAVKNSTSAVAKGMQFVKIGVLAVAGIASNTIGTIQTVYDALKSGVSVLSPTSTITDIQTSYTWNAAESCVFVYFKNAQGSWTISGQYSKVSSSVHAATPTLKVNGQSVITSIISKTYSGSATPQNYDDTAMAFHAFRAGANVYRSCITKVVVTGIEGKSVKTISLANPPIPAAIT